MDSIHKYLVNHCGRGLFRFGLFKFGISGTCKAFHLDGVSRWFLVSVLYGTMLHTTTTTTTTTIYEYGVAGGSDEWGEIEGTR